MKHFKWLAVLLFVVASPAYAENTPCPLIEEQPVKVEMWMAKKRFPEFPMIQKEFAAMGYTEVAMFTYPFKNPSRVVAIGRCVPSYIAQHLLRTTVKYYGEVKSLVHPGFVSPHWVGLASSLFSEQSQQPISAEQLEQLLNPSLSTEEFHALYLKFTMQDQTIHAFGQDVPNPKLMKSFP